MVILFHFTHSTADHIAMCLLTNRQSATHIIQPHRLQFSFNAFNFINPIPTSKLIKQVVLLILVGYNVLLVNA
jgi:hypothetical protein